MRQEIEFLKRQIAYLSGKIEAYERILKDKGFIKEEEEKNGETNSKKVK